MKGLSVCSQPEVREAHLICSHWIYTRPSFTSSLYIWAFRVTDLDLLFILFRQISGSMGFFFSSFSFGFGFLSRHMKPGAGPGWVRQGRLGFPERMSESCQRKADRNLCLHSLTSPCSLPQSDSKYGRASFGELEPLLLDWDQCHFLHLLNS